MANKKITQLDTLTGDCSANNIFPLVEISGGQTKTITLAKLMGAPGPIGGLTPNSGTFSVFQLSKGSSIDEISNDPILQDSTSNILLTSYAIKTYVDNIDTDKIYEGDSSVEVIDDGTSVSRVEVVVDSTTVASFSDVGLVLENGTAVNEFSIDGTLVDNSNDAVPTEKAVKTYVDNGLSSLNSDKILEGDSSVEVIDDDITVARVEVVVNTTKVANLDQDVQVLGIDNNTFITIDQTANSVVIPVDSVEVMTLTEDGLGLKNGVIVDEFSSDGTLAGNSDTAVPTEKAVKTYVDINFVSDSTDVTTLLVGDVALVDTTGGNVEITLLGDNIGSITVKKISSDANDIIVTPSIGTIDGSATKTFSNLNDSFTFVTDTNNFYII